MANLASTLKDEIGRIARSEIRKQTAGTAKAVSQGQRDVAALKRQIEDLQNKLSSLRAQDAPQPKAGKKTSSRKAATKKKAARAASSGSGQKSPRSRFSVKGLKAHRERLGLSADNYGKLIGVSGLSIYNWEQEKARPRESSIAAMMAIRGIGKREVAERLKALAKPQPKANQKAAGKASKAGKADKS